MGEQTDHWTDAIEKSREEGSGVVPPSQEELDSLAPGDTVKISNGFERFFVLVREIQGQGDAETVKGTITNHLVGVYGYDYRDTVVFQKRHVFSIRKRAPPSEEARTAAKNRRRMLKLLGVEPGEESAEADAVLSILRGVPR